MNQRFASRGFKIILSAVVLLVTSDFTIAQVTDNSDPRGAVGITLSPNDTGGALILSVTPGTPAATARLQAGDRILTVDGKSVAGHEDVMRLVSSKKPGSNIHFDIDRQGLTGSIWAVVGSEPDVERARQANALLAVPNVVRARRFDLVAEDGSLLATIGQVQGSGSLAIFDRAGRLQFIVGGTQNGGVMSIKNGSTDVVRLRGSASGGSIDILGTAGREGVTLNSQSEFGSIGVGELTKAVQQKLADPNLDPEGPGHTKR